MMKLEYFIVFEDYGLPIYTSCYGTFCATIGFDQNLFSGFLSALTSMSEMFGEGKGGLKAVDLGYTNLNFSKTMPSGKIVCVGIVKNKDDTIEEINSVLEEFFNRVTEIVEVDYKEKMWEQVTNKEILELEHRFMEYAIVPLFPGFESHDVCGEGTCPFDHKIPEKDPKTNEPIKIWDRFHNNYEKKVGAFERFFAPIYLYMYRKLDIWKHNRREKKKRKLLTEVQQ